jgi:hypothetical protein
MDAQVVEKPQEQQGVIFAVAIFHVLICMVYTTARGARVVTAA